MAQYRELAAFAQFGTEQLDKATQAQLARGQRLVEILKQDQYQPLTVEQQVLMIFASSNRYLDDIEVSEVRRFERELYPFIETNYPGVLKTHPREESARRFVARGDEKGAGCVQGNFRGEPGSCEGRCGRRGEDGCYGSGCARTFTCRKGSSALIAKRIHKNNDDPCPHFSIIGDASAR